MFSLITAAADIFIYFWTNFSKNASYIIAMSGLTGGCRHQVSSQVNLLVNLFSKLYVTFILQWIAFKFGRDEEEDQ